MVACSVELVLMACRKRSRMLVTASPCVATSVLVIATPLVSVMMQVSLSLALAPLPVRVASQTILRA